MGRSRRCSGNLIVQPEVVEQRLRTGVASVYCPAWRGCIALVGERFHSLTGCECNGHFSPTMRRETVSSPLEGMLDIAALVAELKAILDGIRFLSFRQIFSGLSKACRSD